MKVDCPYHENCFFHGDFESDTGRIAYEDHLIQTKRNRILEEWLSEIVKAIRREK